MIEYPSFIKCLNLEEILLNKDGANMVSSISGTSSYQYQSQVTKLTEDQKTTIEEILAKYNSSNMTKDSAKAMFDEIKASGIKPSKELREILDAAGFQPQEKHQGPPPTDAPPPEEETTSTTSSLSTDLLELVKNANPVK